MAGKKAESRIKIPTGSLGAPRWSHQRMTESDLTITRRLESFSDFVIGFCLDAESLTAMRIYIAFYAITYSALAILVGLGMTALRSELSLDVRRKGVRKLIGYGTIAMSLAIWVSAGWSSAESYTFTTGTVASRTFGIQGQLTVLAVILLGQVVAAWMANRVPAE